MPHTAFLAYDVSIESGGGKIKKGELPRLECFHNGNYYFASNNCISTE